MSTVTWKISDVLSTIYVKLRVQPCVFTGFYDESKNPHDKDSITTDHALIGCQKTLAIAVETLLRDTVIPLNSFKTSIDKSHPFEAS